MAAGLLARGVGKGDRVGIWAPNCPEWTLIQYATAKIGAILVNINPAYRAHELQYVLEQAGVRLLVAGAEFKTSDYAAMIEDGPAAVPRPRDRGAPRQCRAGRMLASDGLAAQAADPSLLARARRPRCSLGRPDQHPVHLGHDRVSPRARRSPTTTS